MYRRRRQDPDRHVARSRQDDTAGDFVVRAQLQAQLAARTGPAEIRNSSAGLPDLISDFQNLKVAWQYVGARDTAPGVDGRRACDYSSDEQHDVIAYLSDLLRGGRYMPGPERIVQVPKGPGREGTRPLTILNIPDRVVQRGIVQMIQPLVDSRFLPTSFGGRPALSHLHALARVRALAEGEDRLVMVAADLADYFGSIPLANLWPAARQYLPSEPVIELLQRATRRQELPGLGQGAPVSTLLSNLYGHYFLDRPWQKQMPDVALLRFIDDLLIVARSFSEAEEAFGQMQRLVADAGLRLKNLGQKPVRDLRASDPMDWLGYQIVWRDKQLRLTLPPSAITGEPHGAWLDSLRISLEQAHDRSDSALVACQTIDGLVEYLGPCLPTMSKEERRDLYERMQATAAKLGFAEVPSYFDFFERCRAANRRWRRVRRDVARFDQYATKNPPACTPPSRAGSGYVLHTDGARSQSLRRGGWAYRLRRPNGGTSAASGRLKRTTSNRAELHAVSHGLQAVPAGSTVCVVSDSLYVVEGMASMSRWKANGWRAGRAGSYRQLRNRELWMRLYELVSARRVACRWIRGHNGNAGNERVHSLAQEAAGIPANS